MERQNNLFRIREETVLTPAKTNTDSAVLGTPSLNSGPFSVQFKVADWACESSGHVDMNILGKQRGKSGQKKL